MAMTGTITVNREAVLRTTLIGSDRQQHEIETVLDTGFTGFVTLSHDIVAALKLPLVGNRRASLADGTVVVLDVYLGTVLWHNQVREVLVLQAEGGALIGMALLYGSRVVLNVMDGGEVTINSLL